MAEFESYTNFQWFLLGIAIFSVVVAFGGMAYFKRAKP